MSKLPIVEGVINYIKQKNKLFCMPGHKMGNGFKATEIGKQLYENFIETDITEVDGMDNLHKPTGIIKEAEEKLSNLYGSKKSYFLVNGSTSGNLAMVFSCFNEGDKILVERNCHRSIYNAIILRKLTPIYIKNKINEKFATPLSIDKDQVLKLIDENLDAKGIILTYPNYYGVCFDLNKVSKKAHSKGMKVLVDSAHGAHFGVNEALPKAALDLGADYVVMSAHKTLPSLTQTAYLHIGRNVDANKVDFYVSAFLSTSPSYMFMSSMDYARYFLEEKGKVAYEDLINRCNLYRDKINKLENFHIIGEEDVERIDITRYVLTTTVEADIYKLYEYLLESKLQPEMCDGKNIILIFSPFNEEDEFKLLYKVLKEYKFYEYKEKNIKGINQHIPKMKFKPYEMLDKSSSLIEYYNAKDEISMEAIVPYPPGIPIVLPGEIINEEVIKIIESYLKADATVLGVNEELKIKVNKK